MISIVIEAFNSARTLSNCNANLYSSTPRQAIFLDDLTPAFKNASDRLLDDLLARRAAAVEVLKAISIAFKGIEEGTQHFNSSFKL